MLSVFETGYLVVLICANTWGLTNSAILAGFLFKSRKMANAVQALYEVIIAILLVCASMVVILAQALLWPAVTETTGPKVVQWLGGLSFFGASSGLAFASHRARVLLMTPQHPSHVRSREA